MYWNVSWSYLRAEFWGSIPLKNSPQNFLLQVQKDSNYEHEGVQP